MFKNKQTKYLNLLDSKGVFNNTTKTALPQTVIGNFVKKHFDENKSGKTPKALIIGFDGARADTMQLLVKSEDEKVTGKLFTTEYSAVNYLKNNGGLYLSFAGGEKDHLQGTSTQQGWASILTGEWGYINGVVDHVPVKKTCPTVLRYLANKGLNTAFIAEWDDHFTITYKDEIQIAKEENLPLTFTHLSNDVELEQEFVKNIEKGTDCIFGIFEAPDINGHTSNFDLNNYRYAASVLRLDSVAYSLIEKVKSRETYENEDWLILITSDHGGHMLGHGSQKVFDRMTFIASNKEIK